MKITIWGARGSTPSPLRPEQIQEKIYQAILGANRKDVDIADPDAVRKYVNELPTLFGSTAGGNTPCIQIESNNQTFIIDAGSGIRELGLTLMNGPCGRGEGIIHLFFSHAHWDHIQGFPFFRPAFIPGNRIFIYYVHDIQKVLTNQQRFINFPVPVSYMQATMKFIPFPLDSHLDISGVKISALKNNHPGDAYSFRFEKDHSVFVYASDNEYKDLKEATLRPFLNFFQNADVLIFDAQFSDREAIDRVDWGHSSAFVGADIARLAQVKTLVLFHHEPTYSDEKLHKIQTDTIEYLAQDTTRHTSKVVVGYEGLVFDLRQPGGSILEDLLGGQVVLLTPTKTLDERSIEDLEQKLGQLDETGWPTRLIVDLAQVETLSMAGLKAFVSFTKYHENTSIVLAGPSPKIKKVIELAGFLDFFQIYPSVWHAVSALKTQDNELSSGRIINNRYEIIEKVGNGRFGTVFKANDVHTNQITAVKIFSASFNQKTIEHFLDQTRRIINLEHPNLVKVFACTQDRDFSYIAEEFVEGLTLRDILKENEGVSLDFKQALDVGLHIANALEYAHLHGIIHGDLKPKNVIIGPDIGGDIKVADFGVGRLEEGHVLLESPLVLLTASYLAPEQIRGQAIDTRIDLYALGIILYEMFTGHSPFKGTDHEIMLSHLHHIPRPPRDLNPRLSRSLEHLILKLLAKNPDDRYPSAYQVNQVLSRLVINHEGQPGLSALSQPYRRSLLGKDDQLQILLSLWEQTRDDLGQIVFIAGETGIGKTRLIQEIASRAQPSTLLVGQCHKLEGSPAYQPFVEALRTYFATTPTDIADQELSRLLSDIARLVPEVRLIFPHVPEALPLDPKQEQLRFMTSLAQFIQSATQEHPWLLVLEDLHWADQSSLQLLHYLGRHVSEMHLLIIATYRDTDLEANHPLLETLQSLNLHANYRLLNLERLNLSEVNKMLAELWGHPMPEPLVNQIYQHTEGNPFYVEEVAKGLVDEGIIYLHEGRWHYTDIPEIKLPQSVRDAVLRRIYRLSRDTQTLLRQAAVMGRQFTFNDLCEMSNLSEWEILERLDVALERQLIEEAPGEMMLRFSHAEIQLVLYEDLASLRRRMFHRQAGEALERRHLPHSNEIAEQLAFHAKEGGEFEKALIYSIQAAQQADKAYASQTALTWYGQAVDMVYRLGLQESTQHQMFELLLARERIYGRQGMREEQGNDLTTLEGLVQHLQAPLKEAIVYNRQSYYFRMINDYPRAKQKAERALKLSRTYKDTPLEGESLLNLAHVEQDQGNYKSALTHMAEAYQILEDNGDKHEVAITLKGLGNLYFIMNDYDQAKHYYEQALRVNREIGSRRGEAYCLNNIGEIMRVTGYYLEASSYYQQSLSINQVIGDRPGEAICLNNLSLLYLSMGNYEAAKGYIEQAFPIWYSIDNPLELAIGLQTATKVYYTLKDRPQAYECAEKSLKTFQELGIHLETANTYLQLGLLAEDENQYDQANNFYQTALKHYILIGSEPGSVDARSGIARTYLALNNLSDALSRVEINLSWVTTHGPAGLKNPYSFYLTTYQVLLAAEKKQMAKEILQEGYTFLQKQAALINDDHLKKLFLENVPTHQAIIAAYTS